MKNTLEIMRNELEKKKMLLEDMQPGDTSVHFKRVDGHATVITSDPESIADLNNLCATDPEHYTKESTYTNAKQVCCNVYRIPKNAVIYPEQ